MSDELQKSEVREDKIHDRFVVIAPKRGKRPHDVAPVPEENKHVSSENCPFCKEETYKDTVSDTPAPGGNNWMVRSLKNIFPAVSTDNPNAYGTQEVIVETPAHDLELADLPVDHIVEVLRMYAGRTEEISKDEKIKYVLVFKNHGGKAGASLQHPHSQIFASGFLPPHIVDKLTKAQEYRIANGSCYYCDLWAREEEGDRFIWSDEHFVVFAPYASIYTYEAWFMPRRHVDNIASLKEDEMFSLATALKKLLSKLNEVDFPYNFYLHQAITDDDEHFYIRIAPRKNTWAGVELGSRLIINPIPPEEAAEFYRG